MNFLVIDGNSIINRAFYGIKLLTAKDGHFTNAIFGFVNIFLSLVEQTEPDCIAVAFDVHQPTFRHKMYSEYKAGRKGMPPELFEQMEPLKEILRAYGCHIVECPGFEADDILGTLSHNCGAENKCYIATGDRDSLQLVNDNVSVLLTTTKMGKTQTVEYTPDVLFSEYGVTPAQMIELKALQGDNSDNIPGVPGIGPKTAGELIKKYGNIDSIYGNIDAIEVTAGVRQKLINGKESAYLSRTLGTINTQTPIDKNIDSYKKNETDETKLLAELAKHELFKAISKLGLNPGKNSVKNIKEQANGYCVKKGITEFADNINSFPDIYISVLKKDETVIFTAVACNEKIFTFDKDETLKVFELLQQSDNIKKVTHQMKDICRYCFDNELCVPSFDFDVGLAAYLLDPNASDYNISAIALSHGISFPDLIFENEYSENEKECIQNCAVLPVLSKRIESQIMQNEQEALLKNIEMPLSKVLASMEKSGMAVNCNEIESYSVVLADKTKELETEIYKITGTEFNINSPKQLGVVLFEKLQLPAKKKTKSGYSTSADVLEELAESYPVVSKILEYRTFSKLKSTYCDGLLKTVSADGRIHSTFNQTETRTGRLSSTEPNLQNIPVRTKVGREFRKFFCAKDGFSIVDADYSQIELRVLAAISGDENMINAFNSGEDIHTVTASKVFNVPVNEVTSELRSKAKAVNFGIIYGIGAFSLAKDIKSSRKEAEEFINSYLNLYGKIDLYMKNNIETAKKQGYISTLFNRRRYLPELTSSNGMIRSFGERVARNMPIQGTAADIIKIAMINVFNRLQNELPDARLIMQVHDELIIEAPAEKAVYAQKLLKEEMENAVKLAVNLSVDVGCGKTWYEAKS